MPTMLSTRFVVPSITSLVILTLVYFLKLPLDRNRVAQVRNLQLAAYCARVSSQMLRSDRDLRKIQVAPFSDLNGSLMFHGFLPDEQARQRLQKFIGSQKFPIQVAQRVTVVSRSEWDALGELPSE